MGMGASVPEVRRRPGTVEEHGAARGGLGRNDGQHREDADYRMNFFSRLFGLHERRRVKTEKEASEMSEREQMQAVRERLEAVSKDLMLLDRRKTNRVSS